VIDEDGFVGRPDIVDVRCRLVVEADSFSGSPGSTSCTSRPTSPRAWLRPRGQSDGQLCRAEAETWP